MRLNRWRVSLLVVVAILWSPGSTILLPQSGGGYDLTWNTYDTGGGVLSAGGYDLTGTIGQPDVAPVWSGGSYTLVGGFWGGLSSTKIYLPLIHK
jgi:hypothetical protein